MSTDKLAKKTARKQKEIAKWEREKARPKKNYYFAYLVFIITLIYATDEIASQIGTLMKTEIANDLFSSESSVTLLNILSVLGVPFQAVGLLYRPFADKLGRKTFLIINTFGMSLALLVIFLSNNVFLYFIGACLIQFFIPHDMHVVYIMESAPAKHRARTYSVIKFFANMSVMLVPVLRRYLMSTASEWRNVYLIPAIVGLVVSFVALMLARETDAFIDSRLKHLRKSEEELRLEKLEKKTSDAQGGLIPALKFAMKHKQLRWLFITATLANLGFIASIDYQVIMSYGYAESIYNSISEAAMNAVSTGVVTSAIFLFPVGCSLAQVIMGFISDSKGRKVAALVTAFDCLVCFVGFWLGAKYNWHPAIVGLLCGGFVGSFYSTNDVLIMMIGESAPTNLRSSVMAAEFLPVGVGVGISYIIYFPLSAIMGNQFIGIISICMLVPGFVAALITLAKKTHDTKGINLDTVTGTEWD